MSDPTVHEKSTRTLVYAGHDDSDVRRVHDGLLDYDVCGAHGVINNCNILDDLVGMTVIILMNMMTLLTLRSLAYRMTLVTVGKVGPMMALMTVMSRGVHDGLEDWNFCDVDGVFWGQ